MSIQPASPPPVEMPPLDRFLALPECKAACDAARQAYSELACITSGWGKNLFLVVHKPTFEQELAYQAGKNNPSPTQQAWAAVKFAENCLVYPSLVEFEALKKEHGYMFVDNVAAMIMIQWSPGGTSEVKKI